MKGSTINGLGNDYGGDIEMWERMVVEDFYFFGGEGERDRAKGQLKVRECIFV